MEIRLINNIPLIKLAKPLDISSRHCYTNILVQRHLDGDNKIKKTHQNGLILLIMLSHSDRVAFDICQLASLSVKLCHKKKKTCAYNFPSN